MDYIYFLSIPVNIFPREGVGTTSYEIIEVCPVIAAGNWILHSNNQCCKAELLLTYSSDVRLENTWGRVWNSNVHQYNVPVMVIAHGPGYAVLMIPIMHPVLPT